MGAEGAVGFGLSHYPYLPFDNSVPFNCPVEAMAESGQKFKWHLAHANRDISPLPSMENRTLVPYGVLLGRYRAERDRGDWDSGTLGGILCNNP